MDLILWRHAEAHDAAEGQSDLERGLTAKGERQAHRMGHWLNQALPATTRILVSPALRAQQTARALERRFKTCDAIGPERTVAELLDAARWPRSKEPVLVVGHQPALGLAAAHLVAHLPADGSSPPWRVKKAGLWWLQQREHDEDGRVCVLTVRSPDLP
jgi:phosphohistidine phosphatase